MLTTVEKLQNVTGPDGGPYTVTFTRDAGAVPELQGNSASGMTVQVDMVQTGGAGKSTIQEVSLVRNSSLVAVAAALKNAIAVLPESIRSKPTGDNKPSLEQLSLQLQREVGGQRTLGEKLSRLISDRLGLPITLRFDLVDADENAEGFQAAVLVPMNLQKEISPDIDISVLPDFGPITLKGHGKVKLSIKGNLDLDFGFNLSSFTPYILDTTRMQLSALIDPPKPPRPLCP